MYFKKVYTSLYTPPPPPTEQIIYFQGEEGIFKTKNNITEM